LQPVKNIGEVNRVRPIVGAPTVANSQSSPDLVSVRVRVKPQVESGKQSGARDLRLFRNGQMVAIQKGQLEDKEYAFDNIRLPHEKSVTFSAYAFNSDLVKSDTASSLFAPENSLAPPNRRTFLMNVGLDKVNAPGCADLRYASSDAVRLGDLLQKQLPAITRKVLTSTGEARALPTKEAIRAAFQEIARTATPDDTLLFTFAGHGYTDDRGRFFLFPADLQGSCSDPDDPRLLA
jgi:hypothetical protein